MVENSEEEYELKGYTLLGISFYTINRRIMKRNVVSKNMIRDSLSISSLFLTNLPKEINNNFKLLGNFNWDKLAIKVITYSIIEAFYTQSIEILELEDKFEILNGLYDEKIRKYAVIPIIKYKPNFSWFELEIDKMARMKFKKSTIVSNSNLKEQIKTLISGVLGNDGQYSNPQKEFIRIFALNQSKNLEWIRVTNEKQNYLASFGEKTKIEIEDETREFRGQYLEKRISELNKLKSKDYLMKMFYNRMYDIIETEFSIRRNAS